LKRTGKIKTRTNRKKPKEYGCQDALYPSVSGEKGTIKFTCKQCFLENPTYTEFLRLHGSRGREIKDLKEIFFANIHYV